MDGENRAQRYDSCGVEHELGPGFWVRPGESALMAMVLGPVNQAVPIARISPTELWLDRRELGGPMPGQSLSLRLHNGRSSLGPFTTVVLEPRYAATHHESIAEVRLRPLRRSRARALLQLIWQQQSAGMVTQGSGRSPTEELIDDRGRIQRILRTIIADRRPGTIRSNTGRHWRAHLEALEPGDGGSVSLGLRRPYPAVPFVITFPSLTSAFHFLVRRTQPSVAGLVVPSPQHLVRRRYRDHGRVLAPHGMRLSLRHPLWPDLQICCRVLELSTSGCAVAATLDDLLFPYLELPSLELRLGNAVVWHGHGVVRRLADCSAGAYSPLTCGIQLYSATQGEAGRLQQLYGEVAHPHVLIKGAPTERSWRLFEQSGYLRLSGKSPADFAALRGSFARAVASLDRAPQVGCQVSWSSPRSIEATCMLLNLYEGTWFGYHTAKLPKSSATQDVPGRTLLREIHLRQIERVLDDTGTRWLMGFVQRSAVWPRMVYYDFPLRHAATGHAHLVRFRAWEASCASPLQLHPRHLTVGFATADEVRFLLTFLATTHAHAYVDALNLDESRFDLSSVCCRWAAAGLARKRVIWVARRSGDPIAYAIGELGEEGLHFFHLLDVVRIVALADGAGESVLPLLDTARKWYRRHGKSTFVYLEEEAALDGRAGAALTDLGEADMILIGRALLPDFLDHIIEVTGPRQLRPQHAETCR